MVSIPLQQLERERNIDLTRYITMTYFNLIEKLSSKIVMEDLGKSLLNHHCPTNPNNDHNYPITITFQTEWDDMDPGKGTMKKSTRTHNAATTKYFNYYRNLPQRLTNQPSSAEELDSDDEGSSLSYSVLKWHISLYGMNSANTYVVVGTLLEKVFKQ